MPDPVQPLNPQQTAQQEAKANAESFPRRLPVAADIFLDELAGGPMGMTISTRWGLWALRGKGIKKFIGTIGCKALNLFQANHDANAAAGDDARAAKLRQILKDSGIIS